MMIVPDIDDKFNSYSKVIPPVPVFLRLKDLKSKKLNLQVCDEHQEIYDLEQ